MKQIIPFVKDLTFDNKIALITSISLEHNLKMENNDSIVGTFNIDGKYKINEININEESFNKKIDFDITLDDKYDMEKVIIDIDNFYYEIINEEILKVHIDVLIDNLVYLKEEKEDNEEPEIITINDENDIRFEDEKQIINEDNINIKEEKEVIKTEINNKQEEMDIKQDNISKENNNIFNVNDNNYVTYKVHIIRDNETINTVMDKYKVTKEELIKYNDIDNVMLGSKIIVPLINE